MKTIVWRRKRNRAFSMLELLTVVAILLIVMLIAAPVTTSVLENNNLTRAGQIVVDQIGKARQIASARNCTVEVRLVQLAEDSGGYQAMELMAPNEAGTLAAIGRLVNLPEAMAISDAAVLSPFVNILPTGTRNSTGPAAHAPYRSFRIRPSGIIEPVPAAADRSNLYMTVVSSRFAQASATPSNYVTVQINPDTGSTLVYRP